MRRMKIELSHFGPKPKFRKPLGEDSGRGGRGSGHRPSSTPKVSAKKPRSVAGFFRLERLFLVGEIVSHLGDEVVDLCETTIEARLGRIYALFQSLEASGDRDGDVVAVLVNEVLKDFDILFF